MTLPSVPPLPEPDKAAVDPARMALLGHDLRAAVSDVIGGLRLIDQSQLDGHTRLQLERVRTAGELLARLMEETLAAMLGEEDPASAHPGNLQLARFLYDVEMRWSARAHEKGLGFRVTRAPEVPRVIALDRIALERILSNILSNAVKYTDSGSVSLDVAMTEGGALTITVEDEGPGFSAAALARLFEYEGRPLGNAKPGLGLGMHITKDLTGRLGGSILVENRAEGGARVRLELPAAAWDRLAGQEPSGSLPDLGRLKILVAEDNPTSQAIISQMLTRMDAEHAIAEDGDEALHWLEREAFDLALIDIEMPRMSGIEVIRTLRSMTLANRRMPVIAVTAYVLRANRDAIYAAGADAILPKPLPGIEVFGKAIADVLHGAGTLRSEETPPAPEEMNRDTFERLMSIAGPAAARELLDRLDDDLRRTETELAAGLAAEDRGAIRAATHVLIALAGAVGAERLQALAQTLNAMAHQSEAIGRAEAEEALDLLRRLVGFVADERARRAGTA